MENPIKPWLDIISEHLPSSMKVLVVNKIEMDVPDKEGKLAKLRGIASKNGMLYFEVSARTGQGVGQMVQSIVDEYSL